MNEKILSSGQKIGVDPVVLGIPVVYLCFLISLDVKSSLYFLAGAAALGVLWYRRKLFHSGLTKYLVLLTGLFLVICQHARLGWDARSIWFFHAKIFYFGRGSEVLDTLARSEFSFSHSDYPKLHPFLAAIYAIPFAEWKEQIALSCMALLWMPVFVEVFRLQNRVVRFFSLFCILVLSQLPGQGQIIGGATDWLLACYALIAFLIYRENENRWLDSVIYFSLPMLIKTEGLVISGLGILIILALRFVPRRKELPANILKIVAVLAVPGAAFLLWKIHCSHHGIHNYLTKDLSEALGRISGRLTDGGKSLGIFVDDFGYYNKVIKNMVYAALILRVILWKKVTRFECAAFAFAGAYACFLFLTYLATPFDLNWHMSMSVERTAFPIFLLLLVTLVIRDSEGEGKA